MAKEKNTSEKEYDPVFGNQDDATEVKVDPNQALKDQIRAEIEAENKAKTDAEAEQARIKAEEDEKNKWYKIETKSKTYHPRTHEYAFEGNTPKYTQDKAMADKFKTNGHFVVKAVNEDEVRAKSPASLRK